MCCRDGRRKVRVVHESSRIARLRVSNRFKVGSPDGRPPGPLETERSEHSAWRRDAPSVVTPLAAHASRYLGVVWQQQIEKLVIYFQGIRRAEIVMLRQMERGWSVCLQGTEWKRRKGVRLVSQIARSEEATKKRSGRGTTLADRPLSMTTAI
jgi:hypothetical protein